MVGAACWPTTVVGTHLRLLFRFYELDFVCLLGCEKDDVMQLRVWLWIWIQSSEGLIAHMSIRVLSLFPVRCLVTTLIINENVLHWSASFKSFIVAKSCFTDVILIWMIRCTSGRAHGAAWETLTRLRTTWGLSEEGSDRLGRLLTLRRVLLLIES